MYSFFCLGSPGALWVIYFSGSVIFTVAPYTAAVLDVTLVKDHLNNFGDRPRIHLHLELVSARVDRCRTVVRVKSGTGCECSECHLLL